MPQSQRAACNQASRDLVTPRTRFDFDVGGNAISRATPGGLGECRQVGAGELRPEPGTGVEPGQLVPRVFGSGAMTIAGTFQRVVVQQEELVVGGELGVEFDHAIPITLAGVEAR